MQVGTARDRGADARRRDVALGAVVGQERIAPSTASGSDMGRDALPTRQPRARVAHFRCSAPTPYAETLAMLANLLAGEGLASADLVADVKALLGLSPEAVAVIVRVLERALGRELDHGVQVEATRLLQGVAIPPELAARVVKLGFFIAQKAARHRLTVDHIQADLRSVGASDGQMSSVAPIVEAIVAKLEATQRRQRNSFVAQTGVATLASVSCVIELRGVFRPDEADASRRELNESPGTLESLLPFVLLELITELNDERKTFTCALRPNDLDRMLRVLRRARKRMRGLFAALPSAPIENEPPESLGTPSDAE